MKADITSAPEYAGWLADLKQRIQSAQQYAMQAVTDTWPEPEFVQQAAAQLPWFHLCTLIEDAKGVAA